MHPLGSISRLNELPLGEIERRATELAPHGRTIWRVSVSESAGQLAITLLAMKLRERWAPSKSALTESWGQKAESCYQSA